MGMTRLIQAALTRIGYRADGRIVIRRPAGLVLGGAGRAGMNTVRRSDKVGFVRQSLGLNGDSPGHGPDQGPFGWDNAGMDACPGGVAGLRPIIVNGRFRRSRSG